MQYILTALKSDSLKCCSILDLFRKLTVLAFFVYPHQGICLFIKSRRKGRERGTKRNVGLPQARPWPGMEPATFWCTEWCSNHGATLARAAQFFERTLHATFKVSSWMIDSQDRNAVEGTCPLGRVSIRYVIRCSVSMF